MGLNWRIGFDCRLIAFSEIGGPEDRAAYHVKPLGCNAWVAFCDGEELGMGDNLEFCLELCNREERGEL